MGVIFGQKDGHVTVGAIWVYALNERLMPYKGYTQGCNSCFFSQTTFIHDWNSPWYFWPQSRNWVKVPTHGYGPVPAVLFTSICHYGLVFTSCWEDLCHKTWHIPNGWYSLPSPKHVIILLSSHSHNIYEELKQIRELPRYFYGNTASVNIESTTNPRRNIILNVASPSPQIPPQAPSASSPNSTSSPLSFLLRKSYFSSYPPPTWILPLPFSYTLHLIIPVYKVN